MITNGFVQGYLQGYMSKEAAADKKPLVNALTEGVRKLSPRQRAGMAAGGAKGASFDLLHDRLRAKRVVNKAMDWRTRSGLPPARGADADTVNLR